MTVGELKALCKELEVKGFSGKTKDQLIELLSSDPTPAPKLQDTYTPEILKKRYASYLLATKELQAINQETGLCIRGANPPEDITENMVKFILRKQGIDSSWARCIKTNGDLYSEKEKVQEVKSFTSDGPSSFGPKKKFNVIYFLDMRKWLDNQIVLWRVNLTNESAEWKKVAMNKNQTQEDQTDQGRRPHISWEKLYPQIKDHCSMIYDGSFEGIF